jgi:hypothetical protein
MGALIRWWMIFCAILTGIVFLDITGLVNFAWDADHSKLGFVALMIFALVTPFIGYLTNSIVRKGRVIHKKYLQACWYAADALMGIGMCGTLVGFMMMFTSAMANVQPGNADVMKTVIISLAHGFTTGVITTLIGVVTSLLLKLQLVNLEVSMPRTRRRK